MVGLAIKILAVIAGIVAAFASYPWFTAYVIGIIAFFGALATGIIVGAFVYYVLEWLINNSRRVQ